MATFNKNKLIVFDLDKTITAGYSWARLNFGLGMTRDEDISLSEEYYQKNKFTEWTSRVLDIYKTRSIPTKKNVQNILKDFEYTSGAEECIKKLKKMNFKIAIISSAPDVFVKLVSNKLKIKNFRFNNTLIFGENNFLINISTDGEDKYTKFAHLKDLCHLEKVDMEETVIVGDGDNDELLFKASKYSITFNDSKFKDVVWKTIDSLADLPKILKNR